MFALFNVAISIVLAIIDAVTGLGILGFIKFRRFIAIFGLAVRPLYDTGKTGWWLLISLVSLIGMMVLIVFLVTGSHDENSYGSNPKAGGA